MQYAGNNPLTLVTNWTQFMPLRSPWWLYACIHTAKGFLVCSWCWNYMKCLCKFLVFYTWLEYWTLAIVFWNKNSYWYTSLTKEVKHFIIHVTLLWWWEHTLPTPVYKISLKSHLVVEYTTSGLILALRPANERRRHFVTTSLIGLPQG